MMTYSQDTTEKTPKTINKRHLGVVVRRFLFCFSWITVSVCLVAVMFSVMSGSNIDFAGIGIVGNYVAVTNGMIYRTIDVAANNVCVITNYFNYLDEPLTQPAVYERYWRIAYQSQYANKDESSYGYKVSPFIFTVNIVKDDGEYGTIETLFFDKNSPCLFTRPRDNQEPFTQMFYAREL